MDQKTQYCKDVSFPQIDLHIFEAVTIKCLNRVFLEFQKPILKLIWKCKEPKINKSVEEEPSWRIYTTKYQDYIESSCNYTIELVLVQGHIQWNCKYMGVLQKT